MKGLLMKDFCLLRTRKQNMLLFFVILLVMGYSVDLPFLVGYGTMLFGIWSISTLSYDEFDNGMPFLMTLPITARDYAAEKFLFSGLGVAAGWLVSVAVGLGLGVVKGESVAVDLPEIVSMLPLFLGITSIMLVVELKFGVEKSRTVMMVLGGGAFAIGLLGSRFIPTEVLNADKPLLQLSGGVLLAILTAISAAIVAASYLFGCNILENKEY